MPTGKMPVPQGSASSLAPVHGIWILVDAHRQDACFTSRPFYPKSCIGLTFWSDQIATVLPLRTLRFIESVVCPNGAALATGFCEVAGEAVRVLYSGRRTIGPPQQGVFVP